MDLAVRRLLPLVLLLLLAAPSSLQALAPSRALFTQLANYEDDWLVVVPSTKLELLDGGPAEESLSPLESGFEEGQDQEDQILTPGPSDQDLQEASRPSETQISVSTWKPSTILKRPQKRPSSADKLGTIWIALVILSLVVGLALGAVGGLFFLRLKSK